MLQGLNAGASVSLDGVCMTVVRTRDNRIIFEAMLETLERTTLGQLAVGHRVNIERSAKMGDEIGGHEVSGHVHGKAMVVRVDRPANNHVIYVRPPATHFKYIFEKGFVAIDGISLTVVDVDRSQGVFSIHLIPETLRRTTLRGKKAGDFVNIEIEQKTKALVDSGSSVRSAKIVADNQGAIAIIAGEFHKDLAKVMIRGAQREVEKSGRTAEVFWVPGSYEVPLMLDSILSKERFAGCVAVGYIEKGHTMHGEIMGAVVHEQILKLSLQYKKPVGIGIIGPGALLEQARARAPHYGKAAAKAAISMLQRLTNLS